MECSYDIDKASRVCSVTVTGEYQSPQDGIELQRLSLRIHAEHECRLFLYDMTQARIASGVLQTFDLANPKPELAKGLRKLRGAVLYSSITERQRFFETVAVNRGFSIRVFDTRASAIEWLMPTR